jgi:hypothetical protein
MNATQKSKVPKVIWNSLQWLTSLLFTRTEGIFYDKLCLDGWGKFDRKINLQKSRKFANNKMQILHVQLNLSIKFNKSQRIQIFRGCGSSDNPSILM